MWAVVRGTEAAVGAAPGFFIWQLLPRLSRARPGGFQKGQPLGFCRAPHSLPFWVTGAAVFDKFEICLCSQLGYSCSLGRGFILKLCVGAWPLLNTCLGVFCD